jgi:hypothetical protein
MSVPDGATVSIVTRRSPPPPGIGLRRMPRIHPNTVVLMPMPTASETIATALANGALRSMRVA